MTEAAAGVSQTIVETMGIGFLLLILVEAVLIFFLWQLSKSALEERLKNVESSLARQEDTLRHNLGREAIVRDTQFQQVYTSQIGFVEDIYASLGALSIAVREFVTMAPGDARGPSDEKHAALVAAYERATDVYLPKRIWLSKHSCSCVDAFINVVRKATQAMLEAKELEGQSDAWRERRDFAREAYSTAQEDGSKALSAIEDDFRRLLGVAEPPLDSEQPTTLGA